MSSARPPTARVLAAFALANARYWLCVAGQVRGQMRHWEARAQAIGDPELRALALEKLHAEGFNAEAAAMAATIAPRATRAHAVRAIVALELLYDYLDGLSERPHADPLGEGERLYGATRRCSPRRSPLPRARPRATHANCSTTAPTT